MAAVDLAARAGAKDLGKLAPTVLNVWIYFNLISNTILLPILVATFVFSKRVRRHPTLVNLCITWIFSGIFSLLLFYAGESRGPEPETQLCIAQTSLLYGIRPMWSVAVLMLLYHMTIVFDDSPNKTEVGTLRLTLMLGAPYIVQIFFTLATLIVAIHSQAIVNRSRRFLYCSVKSPPLSNAVTFFTFVVCIFILVLELRLGGTLYRNWRGMRKAGRSSGIDTQLILRVLAFGTYVFFGMVANIISMLVDYSIALDMYEATFGTVVLLVFGTQKDVFRAWCFWRPHGRKPKTIYLPRDPTWRHSIDLAKSAAAERGESPWNPAFSPVHGPSR